MDKKVDGRGGKRINAGRKALAVKRRQYGIRLTDEEYRVVATALYAYRWRDNTTLHPLAVDLLSAYLDCDEVTKKAITDREQPTTEYKESHADYVLTKHRYQSR